MRLDDHERERVALRPIGINDVSLVDALLDGLHQYSMNVDGVPKMVEGAHHLLTATPEGYRPESKHVFAVCSRDGIVGIVDIINDFPRPSVAFIGLLAIVERFQRRGLGRDTLQAVEDFARRELGAKRPRLAVVATNPVEGFWTKMGFAATGEERPYAGERLSSTAHLMEKAL